MSMSDPTPSRTEPLPYRAYLACADQQTGRLVRDQIVGPLVVAAGLAELLISERIMDDDGRVTVPSRHRMGHRTGRPLPDPILQTLLARIETLPPRHWRKWLKADAKPLAEATRQQLTDRGTVTVTTRRILGMIPVSNVSVRDVREVREIIASVRRVVLGGSGAGRADPRTAALVALLATAEVNTVFSGRERREHRARIDVLGTGIRPVVTALHKVKQAQDAEAGGAAG
jgi:hypothetical protein